MLIAHLDAHDAHHDRAGVLLLEHVHERLGASALTLAEVLVGPARAGAVDAARAALQRLEVISVELPSDAPERLATLRAATGLKLPDCCVILAAEQSDLRMGTFDEHLATIARHRRISVQPGPHDATPG